jgi:hypothetical protein
MRFSRQRSLPSKVMAESPPGSANGEPHYSKTEVDEIVARRAVIEQAKGVLMYFYRVNADQAFQMLRSRSREARIRVRLLSEQIVNNPRLAEDLWGQSRG